MYLRETIEDNNPIYTKIRADQVDEETGEVISHAGIQIRKSRFCGNYINALLWGGVKTPPQYRREGCVRKILQEYLPKGHEMNTPISLMHPFSFSYYRRYGFERISDTIQATFPITALDCIPRYNKLVPYTDKYLPAFLDFYDKFNVNRNIFFQRINSSDITGKYWTGMIKTTYLLLNQNEVTGYITLTPNKHFDGINRNISDGLYVHEIGFLTLEDLKKVLGFIRMYEGELDSVTLHDIGPIPEVDYVLKHYMHTSYRLIPDIAAKVLDTDAMLKNSSYINDPGHFTIKVLDTDPYVSGSWQIEFGNGSSEVKKIDPDKPCDVEMDSTILPRFLYGSDSYIPETAVYMDGFHLNNPKTDFFKAFPKRINGLFELF